MDKHDASEQAYKNGYSAGYEAGRRSAGKQKWIPITERLPEESGKYLAYCGEYDGICILYCENLKTKSKWRTRWKEVTHWMPIPEPPNCGADMRGEEDGK